ncbi:MAG: homoserine dehydrogenase [Bryobacteraceae bacterium]|nr:homoserine dehydrogenase [Bryobacteraceae bacterium]
MKLALIGYGKVGRAFARLVEKKRSAYPFRITGVHTMRHGTAIDPRGVPLEPAFGPAAADIESFLAASRADIAVEVTPLNPQTGEPAISHIRAAFARGMHVVTANKGPVAFAYAALREEARRAGLEFRHEAVTMDGTPVYNLVRNNLPGVTIQGFAGALNSTTKVILELMLEGRTLEQGILEAQRRGVAEADPWFDIDGWDSAAKCAALANVLMDARLTPQDVDRKGIGQQTPAKLIEIDRAGKKVVLVSRARRTKDGVRLRVRAEVLDKSDLLTAVRGTSNLLVLETDLMGQLGVFTIDPGLEQTAYGLFSDVVDIARSI